MRKAGPSMGLSITTPSYNWTCYARDKKNGMKFPMSSLLWPYIRTKTFKRDVGSPPLRTYQRRLRALYWSLTLPLRTFLIYSLTLLLPLLPDPLPSYVPIWAPGPRGSLHTSPLPQNPIWQAHKVGLITSQGPQPCRKSTPFEAGP